MVAFNYSKEWVTFLEDILHPEMEDRADPTTILNTLSGKI